MTDVVKDKKPEPKPPVEKKPKKILRTNVPCNRVLTRFAPRSRLNQQVLRSTLAPPGAQMCLRLEIRSR